MKKKNALIMSVAMVLVAVLALTTASFAWFTASKTAKVEDLTFQVTASDALLIGVNKTTAAADDIADINFKASTITATELKSSFGAAIPEFAIANTDKNKMLNAVTPVAKPKTTTGAFEFDSTNGLFYQLKDTTKTPVFGTDTDVYEKAVNPDSTATTKNWNYVSFDLYFRANFSGDPAATFDVSLDFATEATGTKPATEIVPVKKNTAGTATEDMVDTDKTKMPSYYITKALRVGFIATPITVASGVLSAGTTATPIVYEPNATPLSATDISTYVAPVVDHTRLSTSSGITPDPAGTQMYVTDNTKVANNALKLFTVKNGGIYKVQVLIWIEGNDEAAVNDVTGGFFRTKLGFKAEPTNP